MTFLSRSFQLKYINNKKTEIRKVMEDDLI
jgi:hypothetical protein